MSLIEMLIRHLCIYRLLSCIHFISFVHKMSENTEKYPVYYHMWQRLQQIWTKEAIFGRGKQGHLTIVFYCVYPLYRTPACSKYILQKRSSVWLQWVLEIWDLRSGLIVCKATTTGSAHVVCVICDCSVCAVNCLFKRCRPVLTGLRQQRDNPLGADYTGAVALLSELTGWRFLKELQIRRGCKEVVWGKKRAVSSA